MRRPFGLPILFLAAAAAAQAQVPAGPEFRVNAYTTNVQSRPAVASRADGGFVVVWQGVGSGSIGGDVIGRLFGAAGAPLGSDFLVGSYLTGAQFNSSVGADARGGFVVAWQALNGASVTNIFARRFLASGAPVGADFAINSDTTFTATEAAVAVQRDGSFVAVWQGPGRDGDGYGVFGRRVDASGVPTGADFQLSTYTTEDQRRPRAAAAPDGGFIVVWDGPDDFAQGIWARRFDAAGVPVGLEQSVVTASATQSQPDVAVGEDGAFVVVWTSYSQDGGHNGVFGRRFSAAGTAVGGEFRVNSYTTDGQSSPRVAMDAAGNFVVTWDSFNQDGSMFGTFGQRFGATGARRGLEFRVNSYTTETQRSPVVATDRAGNFVAAWQSGGQDGSGYGIFAQRFGGLRPAALTVIDGGNGVLEVPEDFGLFTSWRNLSGAPQAFQGVPSSAVVPSGLSLNLVSPADYGTVADGAVGSCSSSCIAGSLIGTRPSGHVDVSFLESILPDIQGQQQRWRLHVGDSFSDVPRANLFYRYVETLLHHEVTGGCAANAYCPASPTTREGMAVFVLRAKEGPAYLPPACTTSVFEDVPPISPFCRWIEELARRGVVGGCATGRYCPGDAVTREQMAVFVLRTLEETLDPPACVAGAEMFTDVPASNPFCRWIEELARRGVVGGCAAGTYCPTAAVTREQMGVFISLTFGLGLYGP